MSDLELATEIVMILINKIYGYAKLTDQIDIKKGDKKKLLEYMYLFSNLLDAGIAELEKGAKNGNK